MQIRKIIAPITILFPWSIRRRLLQKCFGYTIHPTSRIGIAWVFPKHLILDENASIADFTYCGGLDLLQLGRHATIGRGNWITAYPSEGEVHFTHETARRPELILEEHAAITGRHIIDCTDSIVIGRFSTVAGYSSQIITHSIDLARCRQSSAPVRIGRYCFVGTSSVLLGGCILPDYSVLAAKSLLNKQYAKDHYLYGGVPARPIRQLAPDFQYFSRSTGFVK